MPEIEDQEKIKKGKNFLYRKFNIYKPHKNATQQKFHVILQQVKKITYQLQTFAMLISWIFLNRHYSLAFNFYFLSDFNV